MLSKTEKPYVEVLTGEQKFEKRDIKIGISDGINVEVLSGLSLEDKIKVWNKTEPIKLGDDENQENSSGSGGWWLNKTP